MASTTTEHPSRAWTFENRGLPRSVLSLAPRPVPFPPTDLPKDVPEPEEWILVRVAYAGLNPGAIFCMTLVPPGVRARHAVADMEFSGTVIDVWSPTGEARFRKGNAVVALLPNSHTFPTGTGALAEVVAIPARYALEMPEGVSLRDAGAVLMAGTTAWELLADARVEKGQRVLVNGASGGIGTFAVQMARRIVGEEGFVVGICSGPNADLVKSLGADEVIDYTKHPRLSNELTRRFSTSPFHAIIDTVGVQETYVHCAPYLRPSGRYVATTVMTSSFFFVAFLVALLRMQLNWYWPLSPWLGGTGRTWRYVSVLEPERKVLARMLDMLSRREIRVVVGGEWGFEKALEAYDVLGTRHAVGKLVVKVDERAAP